jgi:hypothetical protein
MASRVCSRAREWSSLQLDGELSELEQRMLEAHLGRCVSCRELDARQAALTAVLRATPLERPARPITVPHQGRRMPVRALRIGAAAALLIVVAGLGTLRSLSSYDETARPPAPILLGGPLSFNAEGIVPVAQGVEEHDLDELRQLRRSQSTESSQRRGARES